jgi:hypothetical protein
MLATLVDVLDAIEGMVDIKDGSDGTPRPNWAMRLTSSIEAVIAKAGGEEAADECIKCVAPLRGGDICGQCGTVTEAY